MGKLDWRINRMEEIYNRYKKNLSLTSEVKFFDQNLDNTTPWFIDVKVEKRENVMSFLKSKNMGSRSMYPPINKQKAYNIPGNHSVSNEIGVSGLWLPSSSKLTNEQIDYICDIINKFYTYDL